MLAFLLAAALAAAAPPPVAAGRYVLHGTGRLDARPLPARDEPVEVLALVAPGAGAGDVALQLRSYGFSCDLRARLEPGGALRLARGQTCVVDVDEPGTRGRVEARLAEGTGRLGPRELSLALSWELGGALRTRVAVPGAEDLAAWTPEVPVRGVASGSARGARDDGAPAR